MLAREYGIRNHIRDGTEETDSLLGTHNEQYCGRGVGACPMHIHASGDQRERKRMRWWYVVQYSIVRQSHWSCWRREREGRVSRELTNRKPGNDFYQIRLWEREEGKVHFRMRDGIWMLDGEMLKTIQTAHKVSTIYQYSSFFSEIGASSNQNT